METSANKITLKRRRLTDHGILCLIALRFSEFWDFVERRQVGQHLICWAVFIWGWQLTSWATEFSDQSVRPGLEIAAIIAAVTTVYTIMLGAVIKWYLDARKT